MLFFHGPRRFLRRRVVALTFDDGPSLWTPMVLDALRDYDARGTFFVLGTVAGSHADVLRRAVLEGHELGNHLYSHRDPLELDEDELERELQRNGRGGTGRGRRFRPRLVRPPYGGDRERVARVAERIGLGPTVLLGGSGGLARERRGCDREPSSGGGPPRLDRRSPRRSARDEPGPSDTRADGSGAAPDPSRARPPTLSVCHRLGAALALSTPLVSVVMPVARPNRAG